MVLDLAKIWFNELRGELTSDTGDDKGDDVAYAQIIYYIQPEYRHRYR